MKQITREDAILRIAEDGAETLKADLNHLPDVLIEGRKGFREYTNGQLEDEIKERFGEKIQVVGEDPAVLQSRLIGTVTVEAATEWVS